MCLSGPSADWDGCYYNLQYPPLIFMLALSMIQLGDFAAFILARLAQIK
jgi:hypothetical protein